MYLFAYLLLVASFLCTAFTVIALALQGHYTQKSIFKVAWAEKTAFFLAAGFTLACIILLYAFISYDFSLRYVASYSSLTLPLFYRATAFWAGQPGSLLFWAWTVVLGGLLFLLLPTYKGLTENTKTWFWCFFFTIIAFFLMILITWSNPFEVLSTPPADGLGLNPLLQNPGMVTHPPILFLGYGGFSVPACLALAQAISGSLKNLNITSEKHWAESCRPFIIVSWLLLTSGIIIGAWWAYMELGWGGYWAWDPVENASLIPWLIASAYLHTAMIEQRRKKLTRLNVFMIMLVTLSAFFATYLVRSGVVKSLHAFGDGGIGLPFLVFISLMLLVTGLVAFSLPKQTSPLEDLFSKEGLLIIVVWLLLTLSCIILIATMWPVLMTGFTLIAKYLPANAAAFISTIPTGLTESFYNRVCLPLFAMFAALLVLCPHMSWKNGVASKKLVLMSIIGATCFALLLWFTSMQNILAVFAVATAFGSIAGLVMMVVENPALLRVNSFIAAQGVHLGLLLVIIGVAFSGPYTHKEESVILSFEKNIQIGKYTFTLADIYEGESEALSSGTPNYIFYEAELMVTKNNKLYGSLRPQLRKYSTHSDSLFPEISTIPGLGDELYASLMQVDPQNSSVNLTIQIIPLVNWLWIGGALMTLMPFFCLRRKQSKNDQYVE